MALQVDFPWEGDMLNRHDGRLEVGALQVPVTGLAPPGVEVTVNGLPAQRAGDRFTAEICLRRREETVVVSAGEQSLTVRVQCDLSLDPRYRFSTDDNIEWLADLAADPDRYPSVFDHWYLGFWRRMHQEYGARIHKNIYYQTVDGRFNLSQLPTRWRDEFEANADWLHLSFHARQDQPPWPYREAGYDQMAQDYELVMAQIHRFASEAVTTTETTVHYCAAPLEACRALADRGIKTLIGMFTPQGLDIGTHYYLDPETTLHLGEREAWHDYEEGLTFVDCKWFVNMLPLEEVVPQLEERAARPQTAERLELLIHEQQFRPEGPYYQPDVGQKAEAAIRWCTEHGYRSCFWSEGYLGTPQ